MNKLNWIEKELTRRYLVGALLHVNKELRTDGFRKQAIIDATNIFIVRLNELATVYDSGLGDHKNTECASCKLCRRVAIPGRTFCDDCNRLAEEAESQRSFPESHNLVDDLLDTRNSQDRDDLRDKR